MGSEPWYSEDRTYRRAVTVDNTGLAQDLEHFQVLITLSTDNWDFLHAKEDGSDICVTDSDKITLIPYYILSYDDGGETGEIWVRVPFIPASDTQTIYIYYGNASPATFQLPPTGIFERPSSSFHAGIPENMVYDSVSEKYYIPVINDTNDPIRLYSANIPDETSWTDEGIILNYGAGGAWDDEGLHSPHLIKDGSTWYLFYTGHPGTLNDHAIGYATAPTITGSYTRYGSNPILEKSGEADWEQYRVAEPYVYYSNILSKWVLLYMGDAGDDIAAIETIGYATADSIGGPYTKYASNPIINWGTVPANDDAIIADPWAYELNGVAYIGYTCGWIGASTPWSAAVVTTNDFVTFRKLGTVYGPGTLGEWDQRSILRGAFSYFDNIYYFPYADYQSAATQNWGVAQMGAESGVKGFDPNQVFDYFDHFDAASRDSDLWGIVSGSAGSDSITDSVITINSGAGTTRRLVGRRDVGAGYMIEFYSRHPNADGGGTHSAQGGLGNTGNYDDVVRLYDYNTAYWIKAQTASSSQTSSNMTQEHDTDWHIHRVIFISASSVKYQNDSETLEEIISNVPQRPLYAWFHSYSSGTNTAMEVDWVRVRKYASTEPETLVGSETTNERLPDKIKIIRSNQLPIHQFQL